MCVIEYSLKGSSDFAPQVDRLIELALEEDIGRGDVTTQALIHPEKKGAAQIRAKEALTVAGLPVAARVFQKLDREVHFLPLAEEGAEVEAGAVLAQLRGPVASILTGERVALNFLMRLSGIATFTRKMAALVSGYPAVLVDTRKTTPGWRVLEKYAVRLGGARNHRFGLYDGVLIKTNHVIAVGSVGEAVRRAKAAAHQLLKVEVEVKDLEQLTQALDAGADVIMLDNFTDEDLGRAVQLVGGRVWLEASGGMTAERLARVAATGVNCISVGALTHSAPAVDLHLKLMGAGG